MRIKSSFLGALTSMIILMPISTFALTQRISVDSNGNEANNSSSTVTMTPDGKYVLFQSYAYNLVANDTNRQQDVFVRNTVDNTTTRVTVDSAGNESNNYSYANAITPDGRYVMFYSYADNLVANDMNGQGDVFIRDTVNNTTIRASIASNGNEANGDSYPVAITPDGRYVLFYSYGYTLIANRTNGQGDIFVRDTVNNTTTRVNVDSSGSEADAYSYPYGISADGRYVLFESTADNLVGNDMNGQNDIFVRDTVNNTTIRVNTDDIGTEADSSSSPISITPDGRYVLFESYGDNLVANDTNGQTDIFVRDTVNNSTTRVNVDGSGNEADNYSYNSMITPDGRYVLFYSDADNLVANDTNGRSDVFVRDTVNNTTIRVSITSNGTESNGYSNPTAITPDGRYVLFYSDATNLVPGDVNGQQDVFVRDTVNNTTSLVSADDGGNPANSYSYAFGISADGKYALFESPADNLVANDTNGAQEVFLNERQIILGAAPTISNPANGAYMNAHDITVEGYGLSGADIRVGFLGNEFYTTVGSNNQWSLQLPSQGDALYTVYAQQKLPADVMWSTTGSSIFMIDTTSPTEPVIISPIDQLQMSGGTFTVIGQGEPFATVTLKVGNITQTVSVDGIGSWTAGPFIVTPGYQYSIVAKQVDQAGNQSNRSAPVIVYGLKQNTPFSLGDYLANLFLVKRGVSDNTNSNFTTGSTSITVPNATIRYTLEYDNVGHGYATGVTIHETVPTNTCYTIGSISGLNSDYLVEYSSDNGSSFSYSPVGVTGQQDCAITDFRVNYITPLDANTNVVSDQFTGFLYGVSNNDGIQISSSPTPVRLTGTPSDSTSNAVADFNNDGLDDVVVGSFRYPSYTVTDWVVWGKAGSNSPSYSALEDSYSYPASETHSVLTGDFNHDTYPDALLINGDGYYGTEADDWIYYGSASGFNKMVVTGSLGAGEDGAVADYNKDGYDDAIVFNGTYQAGGDRGNSKIMWGGATGVSLEVLTGVRGYINTAKFTTDFNNDGYPDTLIGRSNNEDEIIVYGGLTGVQIQFLTGTAGETWSFPVFDIDQDGYKDILFNNSPTPTKAMFGLSGGGFGPVTTISSMPSIYDTFIDLNHDGVQDLIFGNNGLNIIYGVSGVSFTGLSSSSLTGPNGLDLPAPYTTWAAADLDGDGYKDMVVAPGPSNGNNYVIVLYGNGRSESLSVAVNSWKMAVGDFNGDGVDDVEINPAVGFGNTDITIIYGAKKTGAGSYTTILSSTGHNTGWDKLLVGDEIIAGQNDIEYSVYGVNGSTCDMGNLYVGPIASTNGEVDISSISGSNTSICVKADFSIITGNTSPVLRSMIATWNNEDIESFRFDVRVKSGNFSGTTVTNTAYITSSSEETNTGNNSDTHIFTGLPMPISVVTGGFGGGVGTPSPMGPSNPGTPPGPLNPTTPNTPTPPRDTTPPTTVEVHPTTPNIAIKEAIVQTTYVTVGSTVGIKTVENKALQSEKKCYSPKEVVDITLGRNTTNKDQMVYQALLKSYDLTMFSDTDAYKPDNGLKRYEAAKMFTNFAKHVLCREATNTYNDEYTDIENVDSTLKPYIIQAYEYGILKGYDHKFRPLEEMSRKEFVAALMRMFINENLDIANSGNEWDSNYQKAFKEYGLESIVGIDEDIDRYDMSKIMYKLYYNTTYQWTDKGYVLPYSK